MHLKSKQNNERTRRMMPPVDAVPCQYQGPFMCFPAAPATYPHEAPVPTLAKRKRRLAFHPSVRVQPVDCALTPLEKSCSFYTRSEMKAFSAEGKAVRDLSRERTDRVSPCGIYVAESDRGLELYASKIRQRNKYLATKAILKYQMKLEADLSMTAEQKARALARASAEAGRWARAAAIETARVDALRAYDGDYLIPIDEPIAVTPFAVKVKRRRVSLDDDDEEEREPSGKRRR
ncbi:hypothetical protein ACHAWF_005622 [Thalassiosira exigua]